jgi:hypothetical protein
MMTHAAVSEAEQSELAGVPSVSDAGIRRRSKGDKEK